MQTANTSPKFNLADGQLSHYALACGYIQVATPEGTKGGDELLHLTMQSSVCFDVSYLKFENGTICMGARKHASFDRIGEARSAFKKLAKENGLKLFVAKS